MKTIVIDARLANLRHAGLGRYIVNLLNQLPQVSPKEFDYHLLVLDNDLPLLKKKWPKFYSYHVLKARHYSWREQWQLPRLLARLKPDLLYFPHFNMPLLTPWPFVVTIHDLIKHHSIGRATSSQGAVGYRLKRWGYHLVFSRVVHKAKAIIVPSRWTANDLENHYPVAKNKIKVVYEGVDAHLQLRNRAKLPPGVTPPFLLYVGSLYPHKNLSVVLKMMRSWPEAPPLAVVSARGVFQQRFWREVKTLGLEKRVLLTGFVSDAVLGQLYRQALALVFPSRLEGFGLPGLEAMANGCPVIAAKAASLPEIYGNAAVYFSPQSPEELMARVKDIIGKPQKRRLLRERGYRQIGKYSWERMARQIVSVYKRAL